MNIFSKALTVCILLRIQDTSSHELPEDLNCLTSTVKQGWEFKDDCDNPNFRSLSLYLHSYSVTNNGNEYSMKPTHESSASYLCNKALIPLMLPGKKRASRQVFWGILNIGSTKNR